MTGGWSSFTYPRQLADVNGDGMADIVGFGNAGVWSRSRPAAALSGRTYRSGSSFGADARRLVQPRPPIRASSPT